MLSLELTWTPLRLVLLDRKTCFVVQPRSVSVVMGILLELDGKETLNSRRSRPGKAEYHEATKGHNPRQQSGATYQVASRIVLRQ